MTQEKYWGRGTLVQERQLERGRGARRGENDENVLGSMNHVPMFLSLSL